MSYGPNGNMFRPPTSVASGSSSRLATLKGLVPPTQRDVMRSFFDRRVSAEGMNGNVEERKQSWREWAGDKIRKRATGSGSKDAVERISLFPGWASRRYHDESKMKQEAAEFSLDVYVSGYAASYMPPESATRSQRAFMRLAKAYAALPKLPTTDLETTAESISSQRLTGSTEELLKTVHLPPTPSEITEETEIAALEKQFARAEHDIDSETSSLSGYSSSSESSPKTSPPLSSSSAAPPSLSSAVGLPQFSASSTDLATLHANLSARLQAFWSRTLTNRRLRLSVYSSPPRSNFLPADDLSDDPARAPIYAQEVVTSQQGGAFEAQINIPWERLCVHPGALHIAFGDHTEEHELYVSAEILPPDLTGTAIDNAELSGAYPPQMSQFQESTSRTVISVPVTHSQIRLISDVDDTIKLSNILGGAKAVFQNVFVRRLDELVIKGMGEWYTNLWSRGVRFHYVSNGPFELLPVINEFIKVSNLPTGSIRLKSYSGRSLFNGLLSAPATRKREGILSILRAFKGARFFLVGDSGEQDLELYAQLASERHSQILAVFIRDVSGPDNRPLDDPTGETIKRNPSMGRTSFAKSSIQSTTSPVDFQTDQLKTPTQDGCTGMSSQDTLKSGLHTSGEEYPPSVTLPRPPEAHLSRRSSSQPTSGSETSSVFAVPTSSNARVEPPTPDTELYFPGGFTKSELANLPPTERRRLELQGRVYRARLLMPSHIPLRIFKEPEECTEAEYILNELNYSKI